jgi:hypothetical protein
VRRDLHRLALLLLAPATVMLAAEARAQPDEWNIPEAVRDRLIRELAPGYRLVGHINPFYLRGGFDGDGQIDYAFLVEQKTTSKIGIAILLNRRNAQSQRVPGAGQTFRFASGNGDDFAFMDAWQVQERGPVGKGSTGAPAPRLIGDAILVMKKEAASGLIYWDGQKFRWYQQGD